MSDTFDPFDLPSSFDPLGRDSLEPTGQSVLGGAGARLAHLLAQPGQPAGAGLQARGPGDDTAGRLEAFEAEIAVLASRLDGVNTTVGHRLDQQRERLITAVTALLDARLVQRG
jgi:hypothetical protein